MAVKKSAKKAPAKKGRAVSKNGMHSKIEWVAANFRGKTRGEAVAGLQKKYPDISINYARTLVYSYMKDENIFAAGRVKKAKAAKKGSKVLVKGKAKAAPKRRAANDDDDIEI